MDMRRKLGLLLVEKESIEEGLLRISTEQLRRTLVRTETQQRLAPKPKKVKIPKVLKVKVKHERPKAKLEKTDA